MADADRRVILFGKTGTGKSSLANTIFGAKDVFQVSHGASAGTNACVSRTKTIDGKNITLVDTPGLFDADPKCSELSPELLKCLTESAPGPHAFLVVLKVQRYTRQEQAVVDIILKYFSEEALKYATVVFTHGEQLDDRKIEDWVEENDALRTLVQKCGGRLHVFDNKHWNDSQHPRNNNQIQVRELLKTIDQTVKSNGGRVYTNEFLQKVDDEIQQEVRCLQVSCPQIAFTDILQKAKSVVYSKLMGNMEGVVIGVLLGAFLGAAAGVMAVIVFSPSLLRCVTASVTGAAVGGVTGAVAGGFSTAKTPTEAVQQAKEFLEEVESLAVQANETAKAIIPAKAFSSAISDYR